MWKIMKRINNDTKAQKHFYHLSVNLPTAPPLITVDCDWVEMSRVESLHLWRDVLLYRAIEPAADSLISHCACISINSKLLVVGNMKRYLFRGRNGHTRVQWMGFPTASGCGLLSSWCGYLGFSGLRKKGSSGHSKKQACVRALPHSGTSLLANYRWSDHAGTTHDWTIVHPRRDEPPTSNTHREPPQGISPSRKDRISGAVERHGQVSEPLYTEDLTHKFLYFVERIIYIHNVTFSDKYLIAEFYFKFNLFPFSAHPSRTLQYSTGETRTLAPPISQVCNDKINLRDWEHYPLLYLYVAGFYTNPADSRMPIGIRGLVRQTFRSAYSDWWTWSKENDHFFWRKISCSHCWQYHHIICSGR